MSRKLDNYLRMYRKRAGLSQDEMAFLLGCRDGNKVSRYERRLRHPNLQTAMALQVIHGVPLRDLFAGVYEKVEKSTIKRAQLLAQKLEKHEPNPLMARKKTLLESIASGPAIEAASSS